MKEGGWSNRQAECVAAVQGEEGEGRSEGGARGGGRGALGEARLNVACWSAERST